MAKVHKLYPENVYCRHIDGKPLYTPIIVVEGGELSHVYVAGRTAVTETGELVGAGDMRAQTRQVCEAVKTCLTFVGADFSDLVRVVTYTNDVEAHLKNWDVRMEYFTEEPPTHSLLGISRFAHPEVLVELEVEAVMETARLRLT